MKSNPLATRYVAPGKLPWQASRDQSLGGLLRRYQDKLRWRATIVGPHGSGKSTLLEHLAPMIGPVALKRSVVDQSAMSVNCKIEPSLIAAWLSSDQATSVVWLQMRGRRESSKLLCKTSSQWARPDRVLIIDGYEQLSHFRRAWVALTTLRSSRGLLVTSHRSTCLPTLVRTQVDASLAMRLLDQLLPQDQPQRSELLDAGRLEQLLVKHRGNLRELFMELFDEVQDVSRRDENLPSACE